MAYIVLTANGEELDRHELRKPVVLGRSAESDVSVRDILLSRRHCRLEPVSGGGWRVVDLNSKNGTRLGWQRIREHVLCEGDLLRMGRTCVTFHAGAFVPAPPNVQKKSRTVRPADPFEALNGTVTDFVYVEQDAVTVAAAAVPAQSVAEVAESVGDFAPSPPAQAERAAPTLRRQQRPAMPGRSAADLVRRPMDPALALAEAVAERQTPPQYPPMQMGLQSAAATATAALQMPVRCLTRPTPRPALPGQAPLTGVRRPVMVDLSLQAHPQHLSPPAAPPPRGVRGLWHRSLNASRRAARGTVQTASYCLLQMSALTW